MIAVYNWLLEFVVCSLSVKEFQRYLQIILKILAINHYNNWYEVFVRNSWINSLLPSFSKEMIIQFEKENIVDASGIHAARLTSI